MHNGDGQLEDLWQRPTYLYTLGIYHTDALSHAGTLGSYIMRWGYLIKHYWKDDLQTKFIPHSSECLGNPGSNESHGGGARLALWDLFHNRINSGPEGSTTKTWSPCKTPNS